MTKVVVLTSPPTMTLAPLLTMTSRFTATLIPTVTPLPTNTLPASLTPTPFIPTTAPTPTPAPLVQGSVRSTVNFRVGPSKDFDALTQLPSGTQVTLLSYDETKEWYLVLLEDGRRGWVQATFIDTDGADLVPQLPAIALTQVAQATVPPAPPTGIPTLRARNPNNATDVLAYCDLPRFKAAFGNRSISAENTVTIYWTWEARTPEQIQDHIDYGKYEVKLDDKVLENWSNYRTGVRQKQGKLEVIWFVPVGKLTAGEHTIDYKVTWSQKIEDGDTTYGPGGENETDTGSCKFTVR
ncbi:MAG: SH3 domain-containing protein [Anaerolineae bacterium]|nr:SH3 domain-containing protein [Anaerolineae bacterium]